MDDGQLEIAGDYAAAQTVEYGVRKRRLILMLLAYSAILGILSCFLPKEDSPMDFVAGLPLLILGVMWCFTDAAERDYRMGSLMKLVLVLMFIVGLPIYLFRTRGIGGFKALAFSLLLVGAMFTCMFITGYATLYFGSAAGLWEISD